MLPFDDVIIVYTPLYLTLYSCHHHCTIFFFENYFLPLWQSKYSIKIAQVRWKSLLLNVSRIATLNSKMTIWLRSGTYCSNRHNLRQVEYIFNSLRPSDAYMRQVSKLTVIGSDNGLSPGRRQAIIWTNTGILLIGPLGTNFNEIFIEIHTFSFKKIHLKMSSGKWRPFGLGLNVLNMTKRD